MGRTLGITRCLKPLSVFWDVLLAHQRQTAWETYHGNRWHSYREIGLIKEFDEDNINRLLQCKSGTCRVPIHTHSAVASSNCLVKSSRHQVMTAQLHCGQGSSVLKTNPSSECIPCFISWCSFLTSPAALPIALYCITLTCWETLAKSCSFTVFLILHYKVETEINTCWL